MNVNQLITLFRRDTEDSAYYFENNMPDSVSLWSNFQLIQYINQVVDEFAKRTYCFKDSTNFILPIYANTPTIPISDRILKVERAELLSNNRLIPVISIEEFYNHFPSKSWETETGIIQYAISDIDYDTLRLYRIPEASDNLKLTVRRLTLNPVTSVEDELEIPYQYQYGLLHGLKVFAYNTPKAIAAGYFNLIPFEKQSWEEYLLQAARDYKVKTRGPGKIRYGGL